MKRKPPKSGTPKVRCRAKSSGTGLVYDFDVHGITDLAENYAKSNEARLKLDIAKTSAFWHKLKQGIAPSPNFVEWNKPVYRLVYNSYNPLSIVGSITYGGRFNVGGSQYVPDKRLFPDLLAQGCLYGATSLKGAYAEAGDPAGKPEEYELRPKISLKLWVLTDVITQLDIPGLLAEVKSTPMAGIWSAQRSPLQSQLLAAYLRGIGGDGLIFPSTKDSESFVIAFFFKGDDASKAALDPKLLISPEKKEKQ